jgi:hypothetical protein
MRGTHDPLVIDGDVFKKPVERHILLRVRSNQIVKLQTRNSEYRLAIQFRVIETVQEVYASGAGSRNTTPELSSKLGVAAGHERGCLFMPRLDKPDALLVYPKCLNDSVYAIARDAEYGIDAPIDYSFNNDFCRSFRHDALVS